METKFIMIENYYIKVDGIKYGPKAVVEIEASVADCLIEAGEATEVFLDPEQVKLIADGPQTDSAAKPVTDADKTDVEPANETGGVDLNELNGVLGDVDPAKAAK